MVTNRMISLYISKFDLSSQSIRGIRDIRQYDAIFSSHCAKFPQLLKGSYQDDSAPCTFFQLSSLPTCHPCLPAGKAERSEGT